MESDSIEEKAIFNYNKNLQFLKDQHEALYNKLNLYEIALNEELCKPKYELEYKENSYFDIFNREDNSFFYGMNSSVYNKQVLSKIDFDLNKDSFRAFYDLKYEDEFIDTTKNFPIKSPLEVLIGPLVHYCNQNLPEIQITKDIYKFIIFGIGLGEHIPMIHKKVNSKLYLIIEPNIEIFRLSLFVTKYYELAKETDLLFSVADDEKEFVEIFEKFYNEAFILNHYLKFFMLTNNFSFYTRIIQNYLVSQPHMIYSFNRYFTDIERTIHYIKEKYSILNISRNQELDFMKKPIMILGAGPSLQKNIEFLKQNKDKFIIVALYATISFLEKNNIKPDIITQLDEQEEVVLSTVKNIKNIHFFKDTICLFSSKVTTRLLNYFNLKNIFIFQCLFSYKKDFGILTSPSVGEVTYALSLLLGGKEIYFLGIDMALGEDNKSHIDGHTGANGFNELDDNETDLNYSLRKNIIEVKGNLKELVKTTPVFKASINTINQITYKYNKLNHCKVYNFSQNGAFFENIIPLNIDEFLVEKLESLDKTNFNKKIEKDLNSISEKGFNEIDYLELEKKLKQAKEVRKIVEEYSLIKKYSNEIQFRNELVRLVLNLLENKYEYCDDLILTIYNYLQHTVPYILNLLFLKGITNHKRHIKQLNKYFFQKLIMIINEYIKILESTRLM